MGDFCRIAESVVEAVFPRLFKIRDALTDDGKTIEVWAVDGMYVRTYINEEFTNFAQNYKFSFVPVNEFWIDKESGDDESDFFIKHMLVEWQMMRDGRSYHDAIIEADKVERELRRQQGDLERVMDPKTKRFDHSKVHKRVLKGLENGVTVWLVDGRLVRSAFDIDYTEGGHEFVYEYVPEKEVWIDDEVSAEERGYVIVHELHEMNRMRDGVPYSQAHAESSALELNCRQHPDELHDALAAEGWA